MTTARKDNILLVLGLIAIVLLWPALVVEILTMLALRGLDLP